MDVSLRPAFFWAAAMSSYQTHVRLNEALKVWTPMMAKRSQKNPIKKATLTNRGAAFFKLLKIT